MENRSRLIMAGYIVFINKMLSNLMIDESLQFFQIKF